MDCSPPDSSVRGILQLTVMVTNEATQSGLPSFDWTPRGTRALVPAAAPCARPPPRGVQTNLGTALQCYSCEDQGTTRAASACRTAEPLLDRARRSLRSPDCHQQRLQLALCGGREEFLREQEKHMLLHQPEQRQRGPRPAAGRHHPRAACCSRPSATLGPGPAVGSRRTLLCPVPGCGVQGPGHS
ncbi:unnamed protein product [Rangifer tarandus platyrhynchus]|uniref:Uncharacterized protein n=1 Tax=Rangifer tarandus platyrhynchus TaxID=3082113 RepID=A0AC59YAX2_RANTA